MSTTVRVTYDQFDEMVRRGDFAADDRRFELIDGQIVEMPLPGPHHEYVIDILNEWSFLSLPRGAARVRVHNSIGIRELDSLTIPDLAWVRPKRYHDRRPEVADVLLIVEVSEDRVKDDR